MSDDYGQLHRPGIRSGLGCQKRKRGKLHDIVTAIAHFDATTRAVIDGRKFGFCKLIADRKTAKVLGCHVIGERQWTSRR